MPIGTESNTLLECQQIVAGGAKLGCQNEFNTLSSGCDRLGTALNDQAAAVADYEDLLQNTNIASIQGEISSLQSQAAGRIPAAIAQASHSINVAKGLLGEGGLTPSQQQSFLNSIASTQNTLNLLQSQLDTINNEISDLQDKLADLNAAKERSEKAKRELDAAQSDAVRFTDIYKRCNLTPLSGEESVPEEESVITDNSNTNTTSNTVATTNTTSSSSFSGTIA